MTSPLQYVYMSEKSVGKKVRAVRNALLTLDAAQAAVIWRNRLCGWED